MADNGFVPLLLDLVLKHPSISRFALKILTALSDLPQVKEIIISERKYLELLVEAFLTVSIPKFASNLFYTSITINQTIIKR